MECIKYDLTQTKEESDCKGFECIEMVTIGVRNYLLVSDSSRGLLIYYMGNQGTKFKQLDFSKSRQALDRNISGMCEIPNNSWRSTQIFLLFNNGINSRIVGFRFDPRSENDILEENHSFQVNFHGQADYNDLKKRSPDSDTNTELLFLDRLRCEMFVYNYRRRRSVATFDLRAILEEKKATSTNVRSLETFLDKYVFVSALECVHMFVIKEIEEDDQNESGRRNEYSITYLNTIGRNILGCTMYVRKLSLDSVSGISILDWTKGCLYVLQVNQKDELETRLKINFEMKPTTNSPANKLLHPAWFCIHKDMVYLTSLLPMTGSQLHRRYEGENKIYVFKKST